MDAFLPGVCDLKTVWLLRDLWHFHFYGVTPLKLVAGRERIYFEHFWNDSPPIQHIQFQKLIVDSMLELTHSQEQCAQASKCFAPSNRMPKTLRSLRNKTSPHRC